MSELPSSSEESLWGQRVASAEPAEPPDMLEPVACRSSPGMCGRSSLAMCVSRNNRGSSTRLGTDSEISLVTLGVFVMLNCVLNTCSALPTWVVNTSLSLRRKRSPFVVVVVVVVVAVGAGVHTDSTGNVVLSRASPWLRFVFVDIDSILDSAAGVELSGRSTCWHSGSVDRSAQVITEDLPLTVGRIASQLATFSVGECRGMMMLPSGSTVRCVGFCGKWDAVDAGADGADAGRGVS